MKQSIALCANYLFTEKGFNNDRSIYVLLSLLFKVFASCCFLVSMEIKLFFK